MMRVFRVFPFGLVAGQFHAQFRGNILIGQRGSEGMAQGVECPLGNHLVARAFYRLQIQARFADNFLKGFGKPAPSAYVLAGKLGQDAQVVAWRVV